MHTDYSNRYIPSWIRLTGKVNVKEEIERIQKDIFYKREHGGTQEYNIMIERRG